MGTTTVDYGAALPRNLDALAAEHAAIGNLPVVAKQSGIKHAQMVAASLVPAFSPPDSFTVTGTLRYVSPTGQTPAGYGAYYTSLANALTAVANGDAIVLENTTHTLATGEYQKNQISFLIRNESNDRDYSKCHVVCEDNATLYVRSATDANMRVYIKGITWRGNSAEDPALYETTNRQGFFRIAAVCVNLEFVLDHCRLAYFQRTTSSQALGGALFCYPNPGSSDVRGYVFGCEFDHLFGTSTGSDADNRRTWGIYAGEWLFSDCYFHDNGEKYGRIGHGIIGTISGVIDTTVTMFNCQWENCHALKAAGGSSDGGSFYVVSLPGYPVASCTMYDCEFKNMTAQKGGGVWVGGNGSLYVYRSKFIDCLAEGIGADAFGGGAAGRGGLTDDADVGWSKYYDCLFIRCTTTNRGGALRTVPYDNRFVVEGCTFVDCTAGTEGNAIYCSALTSAYSTEKPVIKNCAFFGVGVQVIGESSGASGEVKNCYHEDGDTAFTNAATLTGIISGDVSISSVGFPLGTGLDNAGAIIDSSRLLDLVLQIRDWRRPTIGCYERAKQ